MGYCSSLEIHSDLRHCIGVKMVSIRIVTGSVTTKKLGNSKKGLLPRQYVNLVIPKQFIKNVILMLMWDGRKLTLILWFEGIFLIAYIDVLNYITSKFYILDVKYFNILNSSSLFMNI